MAVLPTVTAALEALNQLSALSAELFRYWKSGKTKEQIDTQDEAERLRKEFSQAIKDKDTVRASAVLDALVELRDKANARKAG